jgi:hypothetical protein
MRSFIGSIAVDQVPFRPILAPSNRQVQPVCVQSFFGILATHQLGRTFPEARRPTTMTRGHILPPPTRIIAELLKTVTSTIAAPSL